MPLGLPGGLKPCPRCTVLACRNLTGFQVPNPSDSPIKTWNVILWEGRKKVKGSGTVGWSIILSRLLRRQCLWGICRPKGILLCLFYNDSGISSTPQKICGFQRPTASNAVYKLDLTGISFFSLPAFCSLHNCLWRNNSLCQLEIMFLFTLAEEVWRYAISGGTLSSPMLPLEGVSLIFILGRRLQGFQLPSMMRSRWGEDVCREQKGMCQLGQPQWKSFLRGHTQPSDDISRARTMPLKHIPPAPSRKGDPKASP